MASSAPSKPLAGCLAQPAELSEPSNLISEPGFKGSGRSEAKLGCRSRDIADGARAACPGRIHDSLERRATQFPDQPRHLMCRAPNSGPDVVYTVSPAGGRRHKR